MKNFCETKNIILVTLFALIHSELAAQHGNYVHVNGVKIYYEIHGTGQPLVLLHPFSGSHLIFEPWIDRLSQNFQLILPDLRGHGNSTNPSKRFRHDESAEDIYALLDELE